MQKNLWSAAYAGAWVGDLFGWNRGALPRKRGSARPRQALHATAERFRLNAMQWLAGFGVNATRYVTALSSC